MPNRDLPSDSPRTSSPWANHRRLARLLCGSLLALCAVHCGGDPGHLADDMGLVQTDGGGGAGAEGVVPSTPLSEPSGEPSFAPTELPGEPSPSVGGAPTQDTPDTSTVPPTPVEPTPVAPTPGEPSPAPEPEEVPAMPTPVEPTPEPSAEPSVEPEPTALSDGDGYLVDGACMPECSDASLDPDGDGWGWENDASCVVADSPAAAGRERCGGAQPEPETPEPTDDPTPEEPTPMTGDTTKPEGVDSSGFYVLEGRLYDKYGNDFVIRGINHGHYWFRTEMATAFAAIANTGANSIRIVWETGGGASELRSALQQSVDLEMVPMIELHDVTGDESNASLLDMARYYTRAEVKQVLIEFEDSLLVNIANEWSGDDWLGGYEAAITELRNAGVNHTLVIDANGWGQNGQIVLQNGQALLDLDPQHNLLFSVHMYQSFGTESAVTSLLQGAVDQQLPIIVGEFGFQHGTPPTQIPYATILSECARLGIGYMPWSWKGNNSEVAYLDMSSDWSGNSLTEWGRNVIEGSNGISSTSQKASFFLLDR